MSGTRYIALIAGSPGARSAWEQESAAALRAQHGFEKQLAGDRLALVSDAGAALALGREGFIVGPLHERGRAAALRTLGAETVRAVVASAGEWLIRAHWGSYVALIAARERDSIELVRAPLGELGCFVVQSVFGLFVASDVALLQRFAGYDPHIDWNSLARHLAAGDLCGRRTCLVGVEELSGGERLIDRAGEHIIDEPWRIWDFTAASRRLSDPTEAKQRVRDAVQTAVAAQAARHERILLRLSGGLDSSIVAACLARAGRPFLALTMTTHDRGGDERRYARAVADHLGMELVEAMREVGMVDLATSAAKGLPRPSAHAFQQASLRAADAIARDGAVTAIFDGGGGDNMFASLQSPAPVADCLHENGGAGHFWRTARSIGIAGNSSTLEVARRALLRRVTRGPEFRWPVDLTLLSDAARATAHGPAGHPWLAPPRGELPGSAAHVALIAGAQSVVQGRDAGLACPSVSPLIAQPVAEACLRVPSWLWTRDGHDRAIARDGFRDALPAAIVDRRDKGAPDSFLVELLEAQGERVQAMLRDGLLARQGLLDMPAVAAALHPSRLATGTAYIRLLQLVDAEAWAWSWLERNAGPG